MNEFIVNLHAQLLGLTLIMFAALFFQIGNMFAGAYANKEEFDVKKFFGGFKGVAILYILFVWLVSGITALPYLLEMTGLIELSTEITGIITYTAIIFYWGRFTIDRAKDMADKLLFIKDFRKPELTEAQQLEGVE
jgi:hypothetical protein